MKDIREYSSMRCPLHGLFNLLTGPWTMYILWLIRVNGVMRFGAIRKELSGISAKVLTERLRMLEEAGVLSRHVEPSIPPKVSYSYTGQGAELNNLLDQMNALAKEWAEREDNKKKAVAG